MAIYFGNSIIALGSILLAPLQSLLFSYSWPISGYQHCSCYFLLNTR